MSLPRTHYPEFERTNICPYTLIMCVCVCVCVLFYSSKEATYTNFIVFGLFWPRLEPTIYHTRSEHANRHTTDGISYMYVFLPEMWIFTNDTSKLSICANGLKFLRGSSLFVFP